MGQIKKELWIHGNSKITSWPYMGYSWNDRRKYRKRSLESIAWKSYIPRLSGKQYWTVHCHRISSPCFGHTRLYLPKSWWEGWNPLQSLPWGVKDLLKWRKRLHRKSLTIYPRSCHTRINIRQMHWIWKEQSERGCNDCHMLNSKGECLDVVVRIDFSMTFMLWLINSASRRSST